MDESLLIEGDDGRDGIEAEERVGGDKSIGFWGSVCLLANNITGPGMVTIPLMFQQAGWLFPTLAFVWAAGLVGVVSMYLTKAIGRHGGSRVEFSTLARDLFPPWLYYLTLGALIFNWQVTNMSAIVVSAQTMDSTLLEAAKKTCALYIYPTTPGGFACIGSDPTATPTDSPFGDGQYVLSLGYIITMALTIPLGYLNLDDNIGVQYGGFILLVLCIIVWTLQLSYEGLTLSNMPAVAVGSGFAGFGSVLSGVVFNFAFVSTVPSWLNEKSPSVSPARSTWWAIAVSLVMFLVLGFIGGYGLTPPPPGGTGADMLAAIDTLTDADVKSAALLTASKIATYVFPSAALLSGIPVVAIIVKLNLVQNKICSAPLASFFGVVFPWIVSVAFYAGNALSSLITWSSALLFVLLNLMLPMALFRRQQSRLDAGLPSAPAPREHTSGSLNAAASKGKGWDASVGGGATTALLYTTLDDAVAMADGDAMHALPSWWPSCCGTRTEAVNGGVMFWISTALAVACLALQIASAVPSTSDGS